MKRIKILKIDDIDFNRLDFSKIDNKNGLVYIRYDDEYCGKIPLVIQIDYLYIHDNLATIESKYISHEFILPFVGLTEEYSQKIKSFFNRLDKKMVDEGRRNLNNWPFDSRKVKYKAVVREKDSGGSDSKIYKNGLIKLKIIRSNSFRTIIYNDKKEIINPKKYSEYIKPGNFAKVIIELASIWFKDGLFGLYIRPHQFRISDMSNFQIILNTYSFEDSSEEEQESLITSTSMTSSEEIIFDGEEVSD